MRKSSWLVFSMVVSVLVLASGVRAGSLGYLTPAATVTAPYAGGGNIPVYESIDALEDALSRGAINGAVICNAIAGTAVEIFDETRTRLDPSRYPAMGDFMRVRILDGDCSGREGWVSITNLTRRPLS